MEKKDEEDEEDERDERDDRGMVIDMIAPSSEQVKNIIRPHGRTQS